MKKFTASLGSILVNVHPKKLKGIILDPIAPTKTSFEVKD